MQNIKQILKQHQKNLNLSQSIPLNNLSHSINSNNTGSGVGIIRQSSNEETGKDLTGNN